MKKTFIFLAAVLLNTAVFAQIWKADKAHSNIQFTITHLSISDVDGSFKNFDATITAAKPDFSDAKFEFTANTASVSTDNDMRDKHIKGAEFFDVEKYPTLKFVSTGIKPAGTNRYKLTGNLTMNGVTKPATFDLVYRGTVTNPMSKAPVAGFVATGVVKRSDYNFGSKYGSAMLSDEVTFKAAGEFAKS